jgi:hypothetical protein
MYICGPYNCSNNWCKRESVYATFVLEVFIITTTTCFGLHPSSSGKNIEYTNGNFAKLITDPFFEHCFSFVNVVLRPDYITSTTTMKEKTVLQHDANP